MSAKPIARKINPDNNLAVGVCLVYLISFIIRENSSKFVSLSLFGIFSKNISRNCLFYENETKPVRDFQIDLDYSDNNGEGFLVVQSFLTTGTIRIASILRHKH